MTLCKAVLVNYRQMNFHIQLLPFPNTCCRNISINYPSIHTFHAADDRLVMCLHVTGGVQWQIQQGYMLLIENLAAASRTLIQC
ncbi:hypothetical protein B7P43_G06985 [Cryptotermes secundus]|uniref:Uncharacterized protein n=1 Tax=Cryptotermes secundus TaxID=105785 RepID=A0A2J7Q8W7_9NEOP|nr:hypothetical protein B7P43_G06985 [Cryptotermes secundus]